MRRQRATAPAFDRHAALLRAVRSLCLIGVLFAAPRSARVQRNLPQHTMGAMAAGADAGGHHHPSTPAGLALAAGNAARGGGGASASSFRSSAAAAAPAVGVATARVLAPPVVVPLDWTDAAGVAEVLATLGDAPPDVVICSDLAEDEAMCVACPDNDRYSSAVALLLRSPSCTSSAWRTVLGFGFPRPPGAGAASPVGRPVNINILQK